MTSLIKSTGAESKSYCKTQTSFDYVCFDKMFVSLFLFLFSFNIKSIKFKILIKQIKEF